MNIGGILVTPPSQDGQACCAAVSIAMTTWAACMSSSRASAGTSCSSSVSWSRLLAVKSRSSSIESWSPLWA